MNNFQFFILTSSFHHVGNQDQEKNQKQEGEYELERNYQHRIHHYKQANSSIMLKNKNKENNEKQGELYHATSPFTANHTFHGYSKCNLRLQESFPT